MRRLFGALIRIIVMILMAPPRGVMWIARKIWQGIRWVGRKVWEIIQWTFHSPVKAYHNLIKARNSILDKD